MAIAIAAVCLTGAPGAQSQTKAKPAPRSANGKPDLSGIWIATGALRLMAGEAEVAAARQSDIDEGRPAPRTEPPPYKPEAEKQRQYFLDRRGIDDPMARCLISGVPRISFRPLPFQILQMPDQMVFLYETHHAFRVIPTDGRPHPEDMEPSYLGDSVAHWEGDTLVVDVTGFNTKTWLIGVGTVHSENLRVTERYTETATTRFAIRRRWTIQTCSRNRGTPRRSSGCVRANASASTSASRTTRICSGSRNCCRTSRCLNVLQSDYDTQRQRGTEINLGCSRCLCASVS